MQDIQRHYKAKYLPHFVFYISLVRSSLCRKQNLQKMCTLFFLVHIIKRSFSTSCMFWFVSFNSSCFRFCLHAREFVVDPIWLTANAMLVGSECPLLDDLRIKPADACWTLWRFCLFLVNDYVLKTVHHGWVEKKTFENKIHATFKKKWNPHMFTILGIWCTKDLKECEAINCNDKFDEVKKTCSKYGSKEW